MKVKKTTFIQLFFMFNTYYKQTVIRILDMLVMSKDFIVVATLTALTIKFPDQPYYNKVDLSPLKIIIL